MIYFRCRCNCFLKQLLHSLFFSSRTHFVLSSAFFVSPSVRKIYLVRRSVGLTPESVKILQIKCDFPENVEIWLTNQHLLSNAPVNIKCCGLSFQYNQIFQHQFHKKNDSFTTRDLKRKLKVAVKSLLTLQQSHTYLSPPTMFAISYQKSVHLIFCIDWNNRKLFSFLNFQINQLNSFPLSI